MSTSKRVGLDFDNTIICYDEVFAIAAVERELLPQGFTGSKQAIKDAIRLRPEGDRAWQRLQGYVYGKGICRARVFVGVDRFLQRARHCGTQVFIVSHKTEYGHFDPERVNLRTEAMAWMEAHGFFATNGFGLVREDIHFEATREGKLARIAALHCEVFVDDLDEVLRDPGFPNGVRRILFSEYHQQADVPYRICRSWNAIEDAVFG